MKALVVYLLRMIVFVSIWVAIVSAWGKSPPKQNILMGVLAWLLSEALIRMWNQFQRGATKGR